MRNIYQRYLPMLQIMIGLALRAGETIGLTWDDVSIPDREVVIDHQLVYKKRGDGFKLYVSTPKTDAGIRTLHMTQIVKKAFLKQREYQMAQGPMEKAVIDGKTNFIFTGRNGLPMMPSAVNNVHSPTYRLHPHGRDRYGPQSVAVYHGPCEHCSNNGSL